jgi:translocation and assembly module TamB
MSQGIRRRKWRWLKHVAWVAGVSIVLALGAIAIFFGSGAGNPLLRRLALHRMESMTGARVELQGLSIRWLSLQVTLRGVVIHGKEPAGTEPLFAADEITARLRIDSFWGRKVSLNELNLKQPHIHIRVEENGTTNVPIPPRQNVGKPVRETLFDLHVRKFQLEDGWVLYNDLKKPLAVQGDDLRLALDAGGSLDRPLYFGTFEGKSLQLAVGRDVPIPIDMSARFTLWREGLTVDQAQILAGRSRFDVQAQMTDFARPSWTYRYRGWVSLLDFRQTLRSPHTPAGKVEVRGEGSIAGGQMRATGNFVASDILLNYDVFHATGLGGRGSYRMDNQGLVIPDLRAEAFDGSVTGRVTLRFSGMLFRGETHIEGVRISQVFPAAEHRGFPIDHLHWDSSLSADTVETWTSTFKHFEVEGESHWTPPRDVAANHVPVTASWRIRYQHDPEVITVEQAEFETSTSRIQADGTLSRKGSQLEVHFETGALERYNDFILAIRGIQPGSPQAERVQGSAWWEGQITGPWTAPTFSGHARGERIAYGPLEFDSAEGDVIYSPSGLALARGHAQRGAMEADVNGRVALTNWDFLPENEWSAEIDFEKVPLGSFQGLLGTSYPVQGLLTGQFHGRGTRAQPAVTGLFDLAKGKVYGISFDHLRGQLNLMPDEARINTAELRIFPPGKESGHGAGIITGNVAYRFPDKTISVDLVGAGLPLENFDDIQLPRLPVAGQLTFRLKASGPLYAPAGGGSFRVIDLRIGQEVIGSFEGKLTSDGRLAKLELASSMTNGSISGGYMVGLEDPYPIHGKVTIQNINLDPFLQTALHLEHFNGHGIADGEISAEGNLKQLGTVVVDAKFTRLALNYANVQLQNEGLVHFRSSRDEFSVEPATFRGADTNLKVEGNVHFTGRRPVILRLDGALDLRLLSGFVKDLDARGPAQVNASIEGTLDRPRITGRVHLENAFVHVADAPLGLSAIKGDFIFDATRLFFENATAEIGGGTVNLSGSVNYADRPLRYDITARTDRVRVRYPEGMSWLASGSLRLTGTPEAGLVSGRVTVDRVTLSSGFDVASALISENAGFVAPSNNSQFLNNLQFDVEAVSSPDARMEWPSAEFEGDANLRVRGTWEHPILLGHIHVLSGDLTFRGNRYRVSRGDLNFANPFQLNPDINVEATTTIQQYEITLDFTGPANKLSLSYRSDPPLPSNDIVTLLALGQTSTEAELRGGGTGASQSTTAGASTILSEAISSQLGGRLEKLFGITKLRVDPGLAGVGSTGSEQNAAARVTVQQQVTPDLSIIYVSNVSSTQQQVIQVEYNVNRNISIVALRDYNGTFGIDIKIKKRFQ